MTYVALTLCCKLISFFALISVRNNDTNQADITITPREPSLSADVTMFPREPSPIPNVTEDSTAVK